MSRRSATLRLGKNGLAKQVKSNCDICDQKFQLIMNQQHQCKRCLRAICIKCNSSRIKIYQPDGTSAIHKICKVCQKEEDAMNALVRDNNLIFQMSSKLSEEWMKKLNKERLNFQDIINQYEEMKFLTNANTIKFKSESSKICQELFGNYNYSMRQFIGKLTEQLRDESIYQSITNVILSIYAYLKTMPYTHHIIYLVAFMLCFCSQFQCYFIITRFIQKIYPQYQRLQSMKRDNLLSHQLKMLLDMYKVLAKRVEKEQMAIVSSCLENKFTTMAKSFTINICSVSLSFYILDEMLKNSSYIYLYKGIAAIIYNSREAICELQQSSSIDSYILSQVSLQNLKNSMMFFQKSNVKFEMDHQFFDSAEHRKLYQKFKQLESLYQKADDKYKTLQNKYKSLIKEYEQTAGQLAQSTQKTMFLQEELLNLSDKLIMIEEFQHFKQQNQILTKRDQHASQTIKLLEEKLQEINKKYFMQEISRKMYVKLQQQYETQIVQLKTKNQLHQIHKLANDINFETSFIDTRFQQKNKKIGDLQRANRILTDELQFYKSNRPAQSQNNKNSQNQSQGMFGNISFIPGKKDETKNNFFEGSLNLTSLMGSTKEQKLGLRTIIEANKDLIQKLKLDLKNSKKCNEQYEKQIKQLKQTINSQKNVLYLNSHINNFMRQAPEEVNYTKSIADFQKIIARETNLHRKAQLEFIINNFKKCVLQAKYRSIDAKLKQNKIRELSGLPPRTTVTNLEVSPIQLSPLSIIQQNLDDIAQKLGWVGNLQDETEVNKIKLRQESCYVM